LVSYKELDAGDYIDVGLFTNARGHIDAGHWKNMILLHCDVTPFTIG